MRERKRSLPVPPTLSRSPYEGEDCSQAKASLAYVFRQPSWLLREASQYSIQFLSVFLLKTLCKRGGCMFMSLFNDHGFSYCLLLQQLRMYSIHSTSCFSVNLILLHVKTECSKKKHTKYMYLSLSYSRDN